MEMYLPDKYKTIIGKKTNLALCTCWFDPFSIQKSYPEIEKYFAITGTLYSKEGVSIILRNLALNPNIRYLLIWGNTPLSNTPFGIAGRKLLLDIWAGNYESSDIHNEINPGTIDKIISNVKLIDISDIKFADIFIFISNNKFSETKEYMNPIEFPTPQRDQFLQLPSEKIGFITRANTIYDTWLKVIDKIMRYGGKKDTDYGNYAKELHNITWVICNESPERIYTPKLDSIMLDKIGLTENSLHNYKDSLLNPNIIEGTSYTYGSRLRSYKGSYDQLIHIITKLRESTSTRRSVGITYNPEEDGLNNSPPCLVYIQLITDSDNKLNMVALFRSHDLFKAGIPNSYSLLNLHDYVCKETCLTRGCLSINSISAHIYEEDWDDAYKLLKCQKWEDVDLKFNESKDVDPRGIVRIYIKDQINIELLDQNGLVIYEDKSNSARDLAIKIARLDLLSRPDHYVDIAMELVKAEICLHKDAKYEQDKSLAIFY